MHIGKLKFDPWNKTHSREDLSGPSELSGDLSGTYI